MRRRDPLLLKTKRSKRLLFCNTTSDRDKRDCCNAVIDVSRACRSWFTTARSCWRDWCPVMRAAVPVPIPPATLILNKTARIRETGSRLYRPFMRGSMSGGRYLMRGIRSMRMQELSPARSTFVETQGVSPVVHNQNAPVGGMRYWFLGKERVCVKHRWLRSAGQLSSVPIQVPRLARPGKGRVWNT